MWTPEKLRVKYIITAFYTIVDDCRNQLQMNQCYQGSWIGWQISYSAQRNKIGFCFDDVTISMGSKRWSASMSNLISNPYLCFWSKTRSEQGFASTTKCVSEMNDMFVGNCGELIVRCIQNCLVCLGACRTRCCLVGAMCCAPSWCPSEAGTRCFVYP